jgi:glycosyltransferase involved in cell wall biosynthesis
VRSLVVARWSPWPPRSGARHRSANVIAALADLGDVDVFLLGDRREEPVLHPPADVHLARTGAAARPAIKVRRIDRLLAAAPGGRPAAIRRQDDTAVRAAFSSWADGRYDLAWFVRIESWLALGSLVDAPSVIDYDDLRDQLLLSRLGSTWPDPATPSRSASATVRQVARRAVTRGEVRAWSRLQSRIARDVRAVVVCSEQDRGRLGVGNAVVVPNGVDLPDVPVGREAVGSPPSLCLHGSLTYGPNVDAARVLVRDVLPRVRERVPDVEVRLVGSVDDRVSRLGAVPGVVVTGPVAEITDELARADVVTVPLRQGAGTRIKVLEALAHRLPVVATSIAVEGLEVVHGEHLLIADEPERFAASCCDLLHDHALRSHLAGAGEALVRTQYGWEHARAAVRRLAADVAADRGELSR